MRVEGVKVTTIAPQRQHQHQTSASTGNGSGSGTASVLQQLDECMQAWLGRGSDVSCLSVWPVVLARSFRSSFFLPASTPLPPPPPPGTCRGGGRGPEGVEKGRHRSKQKGPLPLPTDPDHHPVGAPESKRPGHQGTMAPGTFVEEAWRASRGVRPGQGPRKKVLGANVGQSTYIHIRPAQPNPIQAVPRSFLSTSTFPVELELVLELAPHLTESEE